MFLPALAALRGGGGDQHPVVGTRRKILLSEKLAKLSFA